MKAFILLDDKNIVRCLASEEVNLHKNKLHMKKYCVEMDGTVGDEYNPATDLWIKKPENYPQPSEQKKQRTLIEKRKNKIIENQAIQELIKEGLLPSNYEPGDNDA